LLGMVARQAFEFVEGNFLRRLVPHSVEDLLPFDIVRIEESDQSAEAETAKLPIQRPSEVWRRLATSATKPPAWFGLPCRGGLSGPSPGQGVESFSSVTFCDIL
jgi:hypothetical protein